MEKWKMLFGLKIEDPWLNLFGFWREFFCSLSKQSKMKDKWNWEKKCPQEANIHTTIFTINHRKEQNGSNNNNAIVNVQLQYRFSNNVTKDWK